MAHIITISDCIDWKSEILLHLLYQVVIIVRVRRQWINLLLSRRRLHRQHE